MTKTISAKLLRSNLSEVLLESSQGTDFDVIYRSTPIARITSLQSDDRSTISRSEFIDTLRKIRGTGTATDVTTPSRDKEIYKTRIREKHGY